MSHLEDTLRRNLLLYIIQKTIFCPVTGRVLDIATAEYFVDSDGDPVYAVDPSAYDAILATPHLLEAFAEKGLFPHGDHHQHHLLQR